MWNDLEYIIAGTKKYPLNESVEQAKTLAHPTVVFRPSDLFCGACGIVL